MTKWSIISKSIVFIFICYFTIFTTATAADHRDMPEKKITLNFHQTPTSVILQALADFQQINLIFDSTIDQNQTIKLNNIDWHKALMLLTRHARLQYTLDDNLLLITEVPDYQSQIIQKQQQQKEQELAQPLNYLTLTINHHDIKSLLQIIQQQHILSDRGKAFIDERTNMLVVSDITKNTDEVKRLIRLLDKPLPQVHIAAHIVTMSDESTAELGIKWGYSGSSSQLINQFDIDLSASGTPASVGFNVAKRSGNLLNLELSALEAENQLEIIASPNLITSHKNTASIKQGSDIPYEVSSGSNGSTSIEFKQAVLGLEVTPRILQNNQIELTLYITQNTAGRSIKRSDGGEALAIDTQEIKTQVVVNSGETLVLGGIFQQSRHQELQAVPGVSQIPFVGQLFKARANKQQKRELVIFITPQLIDL